MIDAVSTASNFPILRLGVQMVEQLTRKEQVSGSKPLGGSMSTDGCWLTLMNPLGRSCDTITRAKEIARINVAKDLTEPAIPR